MFPRVLVAFLAGVYFCWLAQHRLEVCPPLVTGRRWAILLFLFSTLIVVLSV